MPLKHAILALVRERRGYGYELVQRFEERVGPGWRLNPSAVYPALDQLERDGLVTSVARRGGTQRSPRIVYAPTPAGEVALDAWLQAPDARPEPVRAELHLRLACARAADRAAMRAQLAAHERACGELLARYQPAGEARRAPGPALVDAAVVARLHAELAWLARARETLGRGG